MWEYDLATLLRNGVVRYIMKAFFANLFILDK